MKRNVVYRAMTLGCATLLGLTACGGSTKDSGNGKSDSGGSASGGTITLGTSLSLTGPLGQFGIDLRAGYQQRITEVNAAGGLQVGSGKRKLALKVLDNRSDANTASQQVRELGLKDHVAALLGACTPPIVVPEALAAEQQKLPYVSSCNPVHAFQGGNKSGWKYAWDLFFDEADQAKAVAKALKSGHSNGRVALFTDTEPDGVAERPLYKQAFAAAGLQVVGDYTFPVGTTDYSSFVNSAKAKGAQLVVGQMTPPDGIALWKQMKSLHFSPQLALVSKASANKGWPKALGSVADGTLSDAFWSAASGKANSAALANTLGKKFPNNAPDLNIAVLGYTVAAVLTTAMQAAGSTSAPAVNAAIGRTDADFPLGHIAFGASTHTAATPYLIAQWQGDNTVVVQPLTSGATLQSPVKGLR